MILLDTDHASILAFPQSEPHERLRARMTASNDPSFAIPIVCAEEQLRGWLAKINRQRTTHQQVSSYERLLKLLDFLGEFSLLPFDVRAADEFDRLRKAKVRIGSADLKIACIALVRNAPLLSANLRDFRQVPDLQVENWLTD